MRRPALRWIAAGLLTAGITATGAPASGGGAPRPIATKPTRTVVDAGRVDDHVILKFAPGSRARYHDGNWSGDATLGDLDFARLDAVLRAYGVDVSPLLTTPVDRTESIRREAERRSARPLPDLTLYYELRLPTPDGAQLCDALNALELVELAYPAPAIAPPPGDIQPLTPDFRPFQGDRGPAPEGIDQDYAWQLPGGRGEGVFVIDVEFDWHEEHEDLERAFGRELVFTPILAFPNHGTAVLGQLIASDDVWGVTGQIPEAQIGMITQLPAGMTHSVARAIGEATNLLGPGDVLLVEAQFLAFDDQLVPVEWTLAEFDAISVATAAGITVIEPAANGDVDLDDPVWAPAFDRTFQDSGAIVVGAGLTTAGTGLDGTRAPVSNYGSRVDVQGWGEQVMTTGYGSYWSGDPTHRQDYIRLFDGTSSAAAQVAGAVASIQGIVRARGGDPLDPLAIRQLLTDTGSRKRRGAESGPIGPRPDLRAAVRSLSGLVYDGHTVEDAAAGNGDGQADPGETIDLPVCLFNGHETNASDTQLLLDGPLPDWLRPIVGTASYGEIAAGNVGCASAPLTVALEPDTPCGDARHLPLIARSDLGDEPTALRLTVGRDGLCQPATCADPLPGPVGSTLRLTHQVDSDLQLQWDPATGADGYRLWESSTPTFDAPYLAGSTGSLESTMLSLPGGPAYGLSFYAVFAVNSCGWEGPPD